MNWPLRIATAAVAALGVGTFAVTVSGPSDHAAVIDGPLLAFGEPVDAYPMAIVRGHLRLRSDCLLLGDAVVFWPAKTSWNATNRSVMFDGDFAESPSASVDSYFVGGGGYYAATDDVASILGKDGAARIAHCLESTGANGAVFAYP